MRKVISVLSVLFMLSCTSQIQEVDANVSDPFKFLQPKDCDSLVNECSPVARQTVLQCEKTNYVRETLKAELNYNLKHIRMENN